MSLAPAPETNSERRQMKRAWWKESVVYQVYPASFKDSNGDGLGDIPGITSELDYIKSLGADILWVSPILESPQVDMGYDISNYRDIHAPYGTMADHDALIEGLHTRGMKYVMDLVVNHTSDQHEWFKQSKSSKDNQFRDWYIWRPAKAHPETGERMPPNNWESYFSGSAWQWDESTQEYYLHLFAAEQPDLNWENPSVVSAVHELIRFWLDRGVDGFRMDVINMISKAVGLPDGTVAKPGFLQWGGEHFCCGPRLHEFFQGLGSIMKEYDAFSVGEMPGVYDPLEIAKAVGEDRGELAMAFQFEIVDLDGGPGSKFVPRKFEVKNLKTVVNKWQTFMQQHGGWNALYMENHDQGRTVSRYASDAPQDRALSSKMIGTHLALQCGTVFVYQGQELAMANVPRDWAMDKYKDIECVNYWHAFLRDHPDDTELQRKILDQFRLIGRDNARTPMQWTSAAFAGFSPADSKVQPWMDIHPDYKTWNAAAQVGQPDSAFTHWQALLALRKEYKDIFVYGFFEMIDPAHLSVVAYSRTADDGRKALVVTNFAQEEVQWTVPQGEKHILADGKLVLGNYDGAPKVDDQSGVVHLKRLEAVVFVV